MATHTPALLKDGDILVHGGNEFVVTGISTIEGQDGVHSYHLRSKIDVDQEIREVAEAEEARKQAEPEATATEKADQETQNG